MVSRDIADRPRLTQEYLKSILSYDPETGVFRWRVDRYKSRIRAGDRAGCVDAFGYRLIRFDYKNHKEHRLAWLYMTGEQPPAFMDHKNHNRADNAWANLRIANGTQNRANTRKPKNNTSGIKGVRRVKNRWSALIVCNRQHIHLGTFATKEEAAQAYAEAARKLFGEFAHS